MKRLLALALLVAALPAHARAEIDSCMAAAADPPPLSGPCGGIRPGAQIREPVGCTLSFVFRNGKSGKDRYVATAGHCAGRKGTRLSVEGMGAIGTVVYNGAAETIPGLRIDFALVKIDKKHVPKVNPAMCHWGGPVGLLREPPFPPVAGVLHYGHGTAFSVVDQTKGRRGLAHDWLSDSLYFVGAVGPGDSGSPIQTDKGYAAGVIIQITNYGHRATRLDVALPRAKTQANVDFQLVTAPLA